MDGKRYRLGFGLAAALLAGAAAADGLPTVTPYRPTLSNPAALSAPGFFEIEAGGLRTREGGVRQASLPYLLKYAVSDSFGLLVGGDARIVQHDGAGGRLAGAGDTSVLLKHRWGDDGDAVQWGVEYGAKLPTARQGLGSGKPDGLLNGIASMELAGWDVDINVLAARQGAPEAGTGRWQRGWAAAAAHALGDRWGLALELSGSARGGVAATGQALAALSYSVSRRITLDFGMARGLRGAADERSVFAGIAVLMDGRD